MRDVTGLLPDPADGYRGTSASMWFLVAMAVLTTARSLAHILLPDGGANSIAGIEVGEDAPSAVPSASGSRWSSTPCHRVASATWSSSR